MIQIERHIIKPNHKFYNECDNLTFLSKNLYNVGLYNIRNYYFENKKYLSYVDNYHLLKSTDSYKQLPAKVANQTLKLIDQNFKSFFELIKISGCIAKIPKYLNKNGRYLIKYEKQAIGKRHFDKTGEVLLSKTNISLKTKIKNWCDIREVRITPKLNYFIIDIVYDKLEKNNTGSIIASIDSGINNLATITFNNGVTPLIINGRPLKSINQYYNKKKAKLKQNLDNSKNLVKLQIKRNNKINDYLHKASRILVNQLVSNNVKTLIIGKNNGQKQDINMGKVNNQNFTQLPLFKFLDTVAYKARLEGMNIIWQEESYTSKASFLNLDYIPTLNEGKIKFSGYRIKRGLYKSNNFIINADVNGSYNIMRKAIPNIFSDGIEGFAINPIKLKI